MPRKPISFDLDFVFKDIFPRFTVKQFDDVTFNIKPKLQGSDYDITGMTGKIFVGVNNDMFMQTQGITVTSNNINIVLDKNMLQKNGRAYAEIELTDSSGTITSSSFIFNIDTKIGEGGQIPGEFEGFVQKYERLISEFRSQVNSSIDSCNDNVDNKLNSVDTLVNTKISDFENRFNALTTSQQQDAEVIDARVDFKGVAFDSLKERIDYTDKLLRDSTVSTIETESDFTTVEATSNGYFEDVKLEGKTLTTVFTCSTNRHYDKWTDLEYKNYKPVETGKVYTVIAELNNSIRFGLKSEDNEYLLPFESSDGSYFCRTITFSKAGKLKMVTDNVGLVNAKVVILEGDHTQNPPSYFEGLKSVGQSATTSEDGVDEISVESVNENLFNPNDDNFKSIYPSPFTQFKRGIIYTCKDEYYTGDISYENNKLICTTNASYKGFIFEGVLEANANYLISWSSSNGNIRGAVNNTLSFTTDNLGKFATTLEFTTDGTFVINDFMISKGTQTRTYTQHQSDKKRLLYYNEETQTWEKLILRQWDSIEKHADGKYYYHIRSIEEDYTEGDESASDYITDMTTTVKPLAQEKVYECTNIDLITYANETNYIVESGAIVPKTTLKVHNNISNVVSLLQKKVSLLESNVKASQEVQDMMILETDMRMLNMELALMEFIPMTLNLGGSNMLRSATYFNFLKNHIVNETYEKEYLENVMNKYLATGRINQEEYNELYKMLYPPVYDIELPIEY